MNIFMCLRFRYLLKRSICFVMPVCCQVTNSELINFIIHHSVFDIRYSLFFKFAMDSFSKP